MNCIVLGRRGSVVLCWGDGHFDTLALLGLADGQPKQGGSGWAGGWGKRWGGGGGCYGRLLGGFWPVYSVPIVLQARGVG